MKSKVIYLILFILSIWLSQAQKLFQKIGENPTIINSSAALEIESTTKGLLLPRMTQAQMNAIGSPANGLLVVCTDCIPPGLRIFNGSAWNNFSGVKKVSYQANSNSFPSSPATGDELFVTVNGTSATPILEQWQFDGVNWKLLQGTYPVSGAVLDNLIGNPALISTPGRYIVPDSGLSGVFVGQAGKYADYDGTIFSFVIPTNNETISITRGANTGTIWKVTVVGSTYTWAQQVTNSPSPAIITSATTQQLAANKIACIFDATLTGSATVSITPNTYQAGVPNIFTVLNNSQFTCVFAGTSLKPGQVLALFPSSGTLWSEVFRSASSSGLSTMPTPLGVFATTRIVSNWGGAIADIISDYAGGNSVLMPMETLSAEAVSRHDSGAWTALKRIRNQVRTPISIDVLPSFLEATNASEPLLFQSTIIERGAFMHIKGLPSPAFGSGRHMYSPTASASSWNHGQFAVICVFAAPVSTTFGTIFDLGTAGQDSFGVTSRIGLFNGVGGVSGRIGLSNSHFASLYQGNPLINKYGLFPVNVVGIYYNGSQITLRVNAGVNFIDVIGSTITGSTTTVSRLGNISFNAIGMGNDVLARNRPCLGQVFSLQMWSNIGTTNGQAFMPTLADFNSYMDTLVYSIYPK